jgi:stage II sporulation protein R
LLEEQIGDGKGVADMVKRSNWSWRRLAYTFFALIILVACWESNSLQAGALIAQDIPQESIRMRILANSDSVADQWIKREVRNAVIAEMRSWVTGPQTIAEARAMVRLHLPELEDAVGGTLAQYGFTYGYTVELNTVPFPAKRVLFKQYPAGEYEALRVTIGEGEGQNWWCVLFPPLCFVGGQIVAKKNVEAANASAAAETASEAKTAGSAKTANSGSSASKDKAAAGKTAGADKSVTTAKASHKDTAIASAKPQSDAGAPDMEVRFFLWDMLKKLFA